MKRDIILLCALALAAAAGCDKAEEECYWTDSSVKGTYNDGFLPGSVMYLQDSITSTEMNSSRSTCLSKDVYNGISVSWAEWKGRWDSSTKTLDLKME